MTSLCLSLPPSPAASTLFLSSSSSFRSFPASSATAPSSSLPVTMTVEIAPLADVSSAPSSALTSPSSSASSSTFTSAPGSPTSTRTSSTSSLERVRLSKRKQFRPLRSIKRDEAHSLQSLLGSHSASGHAELSSSLYDQQIFLASKVILLDFSTQGHGAGSAEDKGYAHSQHNESSESEELDLAENEKELCASLNLSPAIYVKLKESVLKEGPKVVHKPAFKKKAKMDVSKTKKLYDFFSQKRWQVPQKV